MLRASHATPCALGVLSRNSLHLGVLPYDCVWESRMNNNNVIPEASNLRSFVWLIP